MASESWYPKAIRKPITTREYFKPRATSLISIVDHITDGTNSLDWLQNANNGSSVHFLIQEQNNKGVVYQFMPVEWAAWGNGTYSDNNPYMPWWVKNLIERGININHATVSIEHERKWPFTTTLSEPMTIATIELHKWLCDVFPTIRRERDYIIGHYQVDNVRRPNCPGGTGGKLFPFDRIVQALNAPAPIQFPTGYSVQGKFLEFFLAEGGVRAFGYPITEERVESIMGWQGLVQWYERARFELHTEMQPEVVMRGLVGVEALRAREG